MSLFVLFLTPIAFARRDPGVRAGAAGAGASIQPIQVNGLASFLAGRFRMTELEAVSEGTSDILPGSPSGQNPFLQTVTNSAGLGARFNGDQCAVCHSQPTIGGSGGFIVPNPPSRSR